MEYTTNYHLPQWVETDRIMMGDFNDAMASIDEGMDNTYRMMRESACRLMVQASKAGSDGYGMEGIAGDGFSSQNKIAEFPNGMVWNKEGKYWQIGKNGYSGEVLGEDIAGGYYQRDAVMEFVVPGFGQLTGLKLKWQTGNSDTRKAHFTLEEDGNLVWTSPTYEYGYASSPGTTTSYPANYLLRPNHLYRLSFCVESGTISFLSLTTVCTPVELTEGSLIATKAEMNRSFRRVAGWFRYQGGSTAMLARAGDSGGWTTLTETARRTIRDSLGNPCTEIIAGAALSGSGPLQVRLDLATGADDTCTLYEYGVVAE